MGNRYCFGQAPRRGNLFSSETNRDFQNVLPKVGHTPHDVEVSEGKYAQYYH